MGKYRFSRVSRGDSVQKKWAQCIDFFALLCYNLLVQYILGEGI